MTALNNEDDWTPRRQFGSPFKDRFEIAMQYAKNEAKNGNAEPLEALQPIERLLEEEGETFAFDEPRCKGQCGWDGRSIKCYCGRSKPVWSYDPKEKKWRATTL